MTPEGFRQAAVEHGDRVHGYAAWLLGDPEEARDVTQDALMRLWIHRERVEQPAAGAWLLRTAHRLCVDRVRHRGVQRAALENGAGPRPASAGGPNGSSGAAPATPGGAVDRGGNGFGGGLGAGSGVAGDEARAALMSAFAALPLRDRAVMLLREVHDLSYAQLGTVLGLPVGTVKATLHRARARLRDALVDHPAISNGHDVHLRGAPAPKEAVR